MSQEKDKKGKIIDLASRRPSPQLSAMREILKGIGETAQLIEEVRDAQKDSGDNVVALFSDSQRDQELEKRVRNGEIPPESFTHPNFLQNPPDQDNFMATLKKAEIQNGGNLLASDAPVDFEQKLQALLNSQNE